jgi:hypothetical protein
MNDNNKGQRPFVCISQAKVLAPPGFEKVRRAGAVTDHFKSTRMRDS